MLKGLINSVMLFVICINSYAIDFILIPKSDNIANKQGYGVVSYDYEIGKYEITNEEYCAFLNTVATDDDPYELFHPLMEEHFLGGITCQVMSDGKNRYICKEGYEKRPVVCTTWMNAIRYINWLHYNSSNIENCVPIDQWCSLTEGDDCHGAYDTRTTPNTRNKNAKYWLPNRSEWEKAAYYDGHKWVENQTTRNANYYSSEKGWAIDFPHIAKVGLSEGPNGTYDQCGNAAEWIESHENIEWKLALGGSLIRPVNYTYLGITEGDSPEKAISTFGFRICRTTDIKSRTTKDYYQISKSQDNPRTIKKELYDNLNTTYVIVSDINNPGDQVYQFKGSVPYEYAISKTELSNAEYCAFLNAVAVKDDPFHLYNDNMGNSVCGGITRTKTEQGYKYICKVNWENRPIVYITYYDLARYANWMHYGCPNTGSSTIGTTEGTAELGAYNTSDFEEVRYGNKKPYKNFGKRNQGAKFWIPSEDEWYKAAYYDPTIIGNRKYHNYPTRKDEAPSFQEANYMKNNRLCIGTPYFVAPVDSFAQAASYYGTLQQGGNVWEWIESWQYGNIGCRGLRGGSWSYTSYGLNACNTDPGGINDRSYVFGGRICMSITADGWQPANKSLLSTIYDWSQNLSRTKTLFFILYTIIATLISLSLLIYISYYRKKCRIK